MEPWGYEVAPDTWVRLNLTDGGVPDGTGWIETHSEELAGAPAAAMLAAVLAADDPAAHAEALERAWKARAKAERASAAFAR